MPLKTLTSAALLSLLTVPTTAYFRMSCNGRVVRERLDPVVSPGSVSGHVHTISGGSGFDASMTFQQARSSQCSSCEIREDLSNYWTPQLYVRAQNRSLFPVPVIGDSDDVHGGMTVYYLQRGLDGEQLHAFPEGFRMLAGDSTKRNFTGGLDAQAISFNCLGSGKDETNNLPDYNCPSGLRVQVFFPACWNGRDLDSPDHRSHMSYPAGNEYNTGGCPSDYPVHLISLFYEVLYDTNRFADQWYGDSQPFVFANGDRTGYGLHADFVNGWDVNVLQRAVDNCNADSGSVAECHEVTQSTYAQQQACRIPSVVNEKVDGWLPALPGCNPVTDGPEPAPATSCPKPSLVASSFDFVDVTSQGWEYVGCGTDDYYNRTFVGKNTYWDDTTVEKCLDFCKSNGFSYAGLEYGAECWCDSQLDPSRAPLQGILGGCTMNCVGDSTQLCGGPNALSIYHTCSPGSCANAE